MNKTLVNLYITNKGLFNQLSFSGMRSVLFWNSQEQSLRDLVLCLKYKKTFLLRTLFFVDNSIFHPKLELLPKLGKKRAQVAMELLVFLTDLRVNLKESAHFRESCFHFLIRGSKVACELLCFSENRSSEPRKKSCQ